MGSGTIETIGGLGLGNFQGDGGQAIQTNLPIPRGLAVDSTGNVYVASAGSKRVLKIDLFGVITTVAGNGAVASTFSGEGGPATLATLGSPDGLCFDSAWNLYITDDYFNQVFKVDTSGTITRVAGTGTPGYSGDGGLATDAELNLVGAIAIDPVGNILLADEMNQRVRKVDASGYISTVAGTGTAGFSGDGGAAISAELDSPRGLAVGPSNTFYISDSANHRIRRVDSGGNITTVAGNGTGGHLGDGGAAISAELYFPRNIIVSPAHELYIADSSNNVIRKMDAGGTITTYACTGATGHTGDGGPALLATTCCPWGVTLDQSGNLFFTDSFYSFIREVHL